MFPILRRHWTLWAAWTLVSALLLYANPVGHFLWAELVACLGSLLLVLDRRVRRDALLAVGLPAIALLAAVDDHGVTVVRLLLGWAAFAGAAIFAARAVDDQRALEEVAGQIVLGTDAARGFDAFREDVRDEIARARRHERPFAVLSIAPESRLAELSRISAHSEILGRVARARQVFEIADALRDALHRYARTVATDRRVLCCVPELDEEALAPLLLRVRETVTEAIGVEVEIGAALFPRDALSADDLIAAADDARRPRLEPVPASGSNERSEAAEEDAAPPLRDARV